MSILDDLKRRELIEDSLASQTGEHALKRFDRLRRNRNQSEYGSRTFGRAELEEAIHTAQAIRAACANLA